ncbi:hypothetical protein [Cyanobium sp. A1C-AMD]|uniref:hypothetical protein n=1 Tax=Cyanobium sp. A1C-AMD TaxID=2823694 RepID=UPI0020CF3516|nr:hypothetical protein [Cyanobium sp. A1C-AMD]
MTIAMRTSVAISSGGISAQLIRLLPPAGCPGEAVWVPSNEVQRWEQLGFGRAPIPAAELELSWQPAGPELGGLIPIELLLNPRTTPPNAVTVDWGDGTAETLPWPVGGDGNGRLRHGYTSRRDYTITTELTGSGVTATLLVSLAGCSIWSPEPPAPSPGPTPGPGSVLPLIPGAGLGGAAYDGSTTQQWSLTRWSGGSSAGGVPASDGSSALFLCADGSWAMPPGGSSGTVWFNGAGPPPLTLSGADPGDYYLDNLSGNFYVLEG